MGNLTKKDKKGSGLNYGKTFLIGFGFMASSVAWAIYDPYVTTLLNEKLSASSGLASMGAGLVEKMPFIAKLMAAQGEDISLSIVPLLIGLIMTFDNIFGVIFQPTFGKLSDRTRTRFGKRRPYIFIGAPIAAILFFMIPRMETVPALMICIIAFVFVMSLWRAPVVVLMPDLTPPALRSEGNAVINFMGGIGSIIGMFAGTLLCLVFAFNKTVSEERPYVFLLGAVFMILGTIVLALFVKEPDSRLKVTAEKAVEQAKKEEKARLKDLKLNPKERKSLVFMLFTLFFVFLGINSTQTFFALFAKEILGKPASDATLMLGAFYVASLASAFPAGICGKKFGRKKVIMTGIVVMFSVFLLYSFFQNGTMIWPALVIGGIANMFIAVNTLPLVLEIGGLERVGTFTGYYYTATFSAQIAAPIVYGIVRVFTGTYASLFVFSPIAFALAFLCLTLVKHGEADPNEITDNVIKKAQEID